MWTKWNSHEENWKGTKSNFLTPNSWWKESLIHWSSVKAVKAILILISSIIFTFGVNSKINILCGNVNAFVYQGKICFNLQVEIILRIILIIIFCSSIILNSSVIIPSESSTRQASLTCCFPKVDSVFMVDFFQYNLVYFHFVRVSANSQKSCVWYSSMAKLLFWFEWVWWEFCLILFWVILCKPGIHMYCNYLLTTKVTALQVVRTSFQHSFISGLPRPSYFSLPPMVLTLYMYMSLESFRSEFTANL